MSKGQKMDLICNTLAYMARWIGRRGKWFRVAKIKGRENLGKWQGVTGCFFGGASGCE